MFRRESSDRTYQTTQKKSVVVQDDSSSEAESESESDGSIVCTKRIKNVGTNYRIPSETSSSRASSTAESMPESSHAYLAVTPSVVERRSTKERKPPGRYGIWVYPQNVEVWYV